VAFDAGLDALALAPAPGQTVVIEGVAASLEG